MFNVVHKNVRGGSNDKHPVGDFQKKYHRTIFMKMTIDFMVQNGRF